LRSIDCFENEIYEFVTARFIRQPRIVTLLIACSWLHRIPLGGTRAGGNTGYSDNIEDRLEMNTVRTTRIATLATLVAAMAGVTGCATGPDRQAGDPLEPMNRAVFSLNDKLDNHVAKPVAVGYTKVTPAPLRTAIGNVFSNIGDIGNFANNLLQLNVTDATEDLMRFSFNSTFGLGGLIDWASAAGLPKHHEDFGLTLGHYGVPAGAYLVLPLFGPSSIRDASGWAFSSAVSPASYLTADASVPLYGVNFTSARADALGATNLLEQAALDKYAFVRDAYTQRRKYLLNGGSVVPKYDESDSDDGAPSAAQADQKDVGAAKQRSNAGGQGTTAQAEAGANLGVH
jgi:phospholipid-binding lipoprotein MlaA